MGQKLHRMNKISLKMSGNEMVRKTGVAEQKKVVFPGISLRRKTGAKVQLEK